MSPEQRQSSSSAESYDRKVRYRELITTLSPIGNEDNIELIDKTARAVREAENLLAQGDVKERVRHPGEGFLDSQLLRVTSDLAISCSTAVSGNVNAYNRHQLSLHIKENPEFWDFPFPREVPPVGYLCGTFAPTPVEKRQRLNRAVRRQQTAALKAPDNVDRLERTEEGSEMVGKVNQFIKRTYRKNSKQPLSYFHIVLDPDSFSQTVENIYYVSFLVRDGILSVYIDEQHGLPFVVPLKSQEVTQDVDLTEENQFIVAINVKRWKELVEAFKIKKATMVLN